MRLPRPETNPAKLVPARLFRAVHVIATTVLLHGDVALRALFRVRGNPVCCLAIVRTLLLPKSEHGAIHRLVHRFRAAKAERVFAAATLHGCTQLGGGRRQS